MTWLLHINWQNILYVVAVWWPLKIFFFLYLLTAEIMASYITWAREKVLFLAFFFHITLLLKYYWFFWDVNSSFMLILVSLEFHFFSLGLICNRCQSLSMIFVMFKRVLLNFSAIGIRGLFGFFGFEVHF